MAQGYGYKAMKVGKCVDHSFVLDRVEKELLVPYSSHMLITSVTLIIFFIFFWTARTKGADRKVPGYHYPIHLNDQLGRLCFWVR